MMQDLPDAWDVIVIGAGPAGLAAAATTGAAGLTTLVLDENPAPGGQIYRSVEGQGIGDRDVLGAEYWRGAELVAAARRGGATLLARASVWMLNRRREIGVSQGGVVRVFVARRVIVATGALERPFPIPGWTLPGVMTVGAGQTLLKSSALVPDGATVLAGTGPLLWLYAAQALRAGGRIAAILDTTPRGNYLPALRHAASFLISPLAPKGLGLIAEVRRKVPVIAGVTELAALGDDRVRRVRYVAARGAGAFDCETLMLHQGVVPQVNLAMAAGCSHVWSERQLCWVPDVGDHGASSVEGVAIAGDGAGIGGARLAEESGRLAAIGALKALRPDRLPDERPIRAALARHARGRAFLDALFRPARAFRVPDGDMIVCRCEEVTAAEIRKAAAFGCDGPNQLKAFLRCGMGPCQGRMCGLTVTELLADALGKTPGEIGHFRIRSPVKPVSLGELAALPPTEAAEAAVVRL